MPSKFWGQVYFKLEFYMELNWVPRYERGEWRHSDFQGLNTTFYLTCILSQEPTRLKRGVNLIKLLTHSTATVATKGAQQEKETTGSQNGLPIAEMRGRRGMTWWLSNTSEVGLFSGSTSPSSRVFPPAVARLCAACSLSSHGSKTLHGTPLSTWSAHAQVGTGKGPSSSWPVT